MKHRILITDDDKLMLKLYRTLLSGETKLIVDFAESPNQARDLIDSHKYDAALFDIEFYEDEETGFDLLKEMKHCSPETPVLMMSSRDDEETITECKNLGAAGFTSKNRNFLCSFVPLVHDLLAPTHHA